MFSRVHLTSPLSVLSLLNSFYFIFSLPVYLSALSWEGGSMASHPCSCLHLGPKASRAQRSAPLQWQQRWGPAQSTAQTDKLSEAVKIMPWDSKSWGSGSSTGERNQERSGRAQGKDVAEVHRAEVKAPWGQAHDTASTSMRRAEHFSLG